MGFSHWEKYNEMPEIQNLPEGKIMKQIAKLNLSFMIAW